MLLDAAGNEVGFVSKELAPLFPFCFFGGPVVFHYPGKKDIFLLGF